MLGLQVIVPRGGVWVVPEDACLPVLVWGGKMESKEEGGETADWEEECKYIKYDTGCLL